MKREELELLKKYLQGKTSSEESEYVRKLLAGSELDYETKKLLLDEWRKTSDKNELGIDIGEAWIEFKKKSFSDPGAYERKLDRSQSTGSNRISKRIYFPLVAASFFILLFSAAVFFMIYQSKDSHPEKITYNTKKTERGEKLNISLPDGSFIKLNSSTLLKIPSDYNTNDERVVYLEGEAFFEIAKFENKPFKVITGEIITEVLGTRFNVNSYSPNEDVSIAVVEGKVRVANSKNQVILHPEEMTTVNPFHEQISKHNFDMDFVTGWRNNLLIFDDVTFDEIVEKLKQWYGVEFVIEGNPKDTGKYSGRFENKSLQLVLEGLGFSSEFEYKIIDKTVYLKFK